MITAVPNRSTWSPTRRFRIAAAALVAAASLAIAGCSGTPATDPDGEAPADLTDIVVVSFLPLQSFTFTPEMYAYSSGIFEEHGLDVQLQPVQGTAAAIQTLLGGATPITRVSTVDVMPGMESGQPIVAIGTQAYRSNLRIISTEGNAIESAEDMEGKTIGMGSVGGTSEKMLNFALDAAGVPRDSVTRQAVPVTAATYELVKQGQLDGYIVSLDTSIGIVNQNPDAVSSPAGLVDAPERQVWITTQTNLENEDRVDQIERFLAAIKEATQEIIDDSENDFANVLATLRDSGDWEFAALDDDAIAVEALTTYTTETWIDSTGTVGLLENDDDYWTTIYDAYVDGGLLKGGGDPGAWITSDLLPAD
jgi:NitT/TauT family transport system substrate-binding protein